MKKVRLLVLSCLIFLSFDTASWAQKKAAPPKSIGDGPSLEATMKFVHDKVSEQGKVNFAVFTHDAITGEDGASQYSFEVTDISLDASNCNYRVQSDFSSGSGSTKVDSSTTAQGPVKSMTDSVQVMTAEYWWKLELAEEGTPSRIPRVEPAYFVLSMGRAKKAEHCEQNGKEVACGDPKLPDRVFKTWIFRDEDTGNRVAKALVHAVELCGGGNKDPF